MENQDRSVASQLSGLETFLHADSVSFLSSILRSELRSGPCSLAPLLAAAAVLGAPAQLHGPPVGGRGRHQHGAADTAQLRGESAEAVLLVGHRLLLHHLPPLRHLLEHLCIWSTRSADPASSLMMRPLTPSLCPTALLCIHIDSKQSPPSLTVIHFPISSKV